MDGEIEATSRLGVGTTFVVHLQPAEATAGGEESNAGNAEGAASSNVSRKTLLCIEDNPANLRLIDRVVAKHSNATLLTAMQGGTGIELAQTHHPDLILLDLHLPDISGEDCLHMLKADERTAAIPVIVVSADAAKSRREQLFAAGAAGFVTKPIVIREFLRVLGDLDTQPASVSLGAG